MTPTANETARQKRCNNRCAPRIRDLLNEWQELDEQANKVQTDLDQIWSLKFQTELRLCKIKQQQRGCIKDILRYLEMIDSLC